MTTWTGEEVDKVAEPTKEEKRAKYQKLWDEQEVKNPTAFNPLPVTRVEQLFELSKDPAIDLRTKVTEREMRLIIQHQEISNHLFGVLGGAVLEPKIFAGLMTAVCNHLGIETPSDRKKTA